MKDSSNTINSLAHTKWNCKYHVVFAPKYRTCVIQKILPLLNLIRTPLNSNIH